MYDADTHGEEACASRGGLPLGFMQSDIAINKKTPVLSNTPAKFSVVSG
jgi:hypothetical protein